MYPLCWPESQQAGGVVMEKLFLPSGVGLGMLGPCSPREFQEYNPGGFTALLKRHEGAYHALALAFRLSETPVRQHFCLAGDAAAAWYLGMEPPPYLEFWGDRKLPLPVQVRRWLSDAAPGLRIHRISSCRFWQHWQVGSAIVSFYPAPFPYRLSPVPGRMFHPGLGDLALVALPEIAYARALDLSFRRVPDYHRAFTFFYLLLQRSFLTLPSLIYSTEDYFNLGGNLRGPFNRTWFLAKLIDSAQFVAAADAAEMPWARNGRPFPSFMARYLRRQVLAFCLDSLQPRLSLPPSPPDLARGIISEGDWDRIRELFSRYNPVSIYDALQTALNITAEAKTLWLTVSMAAVMSYRPDAAASVS